MCAKNFLWIRFGVEVAGYGTFEYTAHSCAYLISDQVEHISRVIINIGVSGGQYHGYYSVNWSTGNVYFNVYIITGEWKLSDIYHHYITWCHNNINYIS